MSGLADVTGSLALAVTAGALAAGAVTLARTRRPAVALPVLLDLLLAAGLLRLAGDSGWAGIGTAAAVVVLRRLVATGLRIDRRSLESGPGAAAFPPAGWVRAALRPAWASAPPTRRPARPRPQPADPVPGRG